MRGWPRAVRVMLGLVWEVGAPLLLGFALLSVAGSVIPFGFALGLRPLANGIHRGAEGAVSAGAGACGLALLLLAVLPSASAAIQDRFIERSIMVFQRRMLGLCTEAAHLDHFERADFWDRVQVLQRGVQELLGSAANLFIGPAILLELVAAAVVLARLEPVLLLLPLIAVPAMLLGRSADRLQRRAEMRSAEARREAEHLFALASEPGPAKEIRIYGLREELLRRHRGLCAAAGRATEAARLSGAGLAGLGWLIFAGGYAGAVVLTLRAAAAGRLSPGDIAMTLTLATALVAAAGGLAGIMDLLLRGKAAAGDYLALAEHAAVGGPGTGAAPVPAGLTQGFALRGVSFAYPGTERPVLEAVDLDLPAGAVVALVGENGAGKTTLCKLLLRLYAPTGGLIAADGADIAGFDLPAYRGRLSAGFQDFVRFELSAREAVGIGDPPRMGDEAAVRRAVARAGADFVHDLAAGWDTQLGVRWEGGVDLSGGEWQKLALARAFMRPDPLLTVFDEPTAALDPQTEEALFGRVAAEARAGGAAGRVTVLVSHRFSTVRAADRIVVLRAGRVVEVGSHAELVARAGLYAELYGLQSAAYR